jgi:hypothetical protein
VDSGTFARLTSAAAAAAPHPASCAAGGAQEPLVVTGPAVCPLPGWLLYPPAHALTAAAALLRAAGGLQFEPFLTPADVRKVVRHNYYDSAQAARVLGWAPAVSPAAGMAEVVAYYRELGFDGGTAVEAPGPAVYAVVLTGLGLTAALAFDVGGLLSMARCHSWRRDHH